MTPAIDYFPPRALDYTKCTQNVWKWQNASMLFLFFQNVLYNINYNIWHTKQQGVTTKSPHYTPTCNLSDSCCMVYICIQLSSINYVHGSYCTNSHTTDSFWSQKRDDSLRTEKSCQSFCTTIVKCTTKKIVYYIK